MAYIIENFNYMVFIGTSLNIIDNSGALKATCIHLYNKKKAIIGDKILVSLRRVKPLRKVDKGQVFKALVVRSNCFFLYKGGHSIVCNTNCVILIKKNDDVMGSRFRGPIFYKLIEKKFSKALSLSSNVY